MEKLPKVDFTSIEQIKKHDWWGNAYHDMPAFMAIGRFVKDEANSMEASAEAIRQQTDAGMGMGREDHISDIDLVTEWIENI